MVSVTMTFLSVYAEQQDAFALPRAELRLLRGGALGDRALPKTARPTMRFFKVVVEP